MRASDFEERKLSKGEEKEKERIVKGMKKAKGSFKDRYGKDAEAVMYATATKLAKGESKQTEGYAVLPPIPDKYQKRDGLEGPIMTRSGKVVYYDNVEGKYYDPDTDMYMTYDEWKAYDPELPIKAEGVKRNAIYQQVGKMLAKGHSMDAIKKRYNDLDKANPGYLEKIAQALKDRNEIPYDKYKSIKVKEEKKNCGCNQDPCITYGKQEESKDEYEPHMMYKGTKKDYRAKFPKKKKQHDSLMKRGYNHDDPETKKVEEYVFTRKDFLDNEAENLHSENAVELAKKFGTPKEIKQMDDILTRHNKRGHITPEDMETRDALVRKYYSMLEGKKEDEDYEAKLKALLKIQMDPNTAKDPELKKELMRRKAKLLKTKESLENEIEWTLQEKALAEGYEGAIIHALKQEGIYGFFNKGTLYIEYDADMERVEEIVNQTVEIPPEIKPDSEYYKVESKQKPYVSMYRDGNNGKMIYDVLDKNGDSVYKTNDKTLAMAYLKKNYKDISEKDQEAGLQGSVTPQQISKEFPGIQDKNSFIQALLKMKRGDTNYSRNQMIAAADAFKELLSKDPMETQKLMMMLKRVKAKQTQ